MEKRRILVLTSSTGGGHDARATAIGAWVEQLHAPCVEVKIEKILENSSALNRFGVGVYNAIQRDLPCLHNVYWWIVEAYGILVNTFWFAGHSYYKKLLLTYRPHLILSVHDATNRVFFRIAKKVLNPINVQCVTYCGEFTGGSGYSRHWVAPCVDRFYARTASALQYALKLGIVPDKAAVFQNVLSPEAFSEKEEERRKWTKFRTEVLGLKPDKFTVFLATGSEGANRHLSLLQAILNLGDHVQAIAVCGKNQKPFNELLKWKQRNQGFSIFVESYSSKIHQLMQASDVVVTRGGSNTATEALFFGCPLIFNCIGGTMPQERLTIDYFIDHRAAVKIRQPSELTAILREWMSFSDTYWRTKENLKSLCRKDRPATLINDIVELANRAVNIQ